MSADPSVPPLHIGAEEWLRRSARREEIAYRHDACLRRTNPEAPGNAVSLPVVRWPKPDAALMSANYVLSWISFGHVRELDALNDLGEAYRWGHTDLHRTLAAVYAIIAGTWEPEDSRHPAWAEDGPAWINALRVRIEQQDRVALSLQKLGEMLAEHIEWHRQACALLYRAEHELLEALRGGKLTAYGRRNGAGQHQAIPVTVFMDAQVGVNWFNTVEGEHLGPRYTDVQFQRDDVLDLWPEQQSEPSAPMEPQQAQSSEITEPQQPERREAVALATVSRPKHPGGRPPKYDWAAFDCEMIRLANTPDGLPDRATLFGHMAQWCTNKWGDAPADSKIRDRIAKRYPKG
jgi:hypothetical protein